MVGAKTGFYLPLVCYNVRMDYLTWALILLGFGLVCLVLEFFVPSSGALGVLCALSLVNASLQNVNAALARHPMLWCRRPDRDGFLDVRLGLGTLPSRNEIETPTTRNTTPELWRELTDVTARFATVERVPLVGALGATLGEVTKAMHLEHGVEAVDEPRTTPGEPTACHLQVVGEAGPFPVSGDHGVPVLVVVQGM